MNMEQDTYEGLDSEVMSLEEEFIAQLREKGIRVSRIILKHTHPSSRNGRETYLKKREIEEGDTTSTKKVIVEKTEQQKTLYPGTNIYLNELGISNSEINDAVSYYGKMTVKVVARIAYDYAQKNGLDNKKVRDEVPYLFEAIDSLGQKTVHELVLRTGKDPSHLLTNFDINKIEGINVITPRKKVPLEVLANSNTIISVPYIKEDTNTVMFEYATK